MKHFVVELTYVAPLDAIDAAVGGHREFLAQGYAKGMLLFSGPQEPRTGGLIVGRAETRAEFEAFFADDPYRKQNLATYRFIEFNPVRHQSFLKDAWL